jgi:hypothetical protein
MPRQEISWKRRTPDGQTVRIYARHVGDQWKFFARGARYEQRATLADPTLDDWLELLDAVQRRVGRGLLRAEEVERVERAIRERFPTAEL